VIILKIGVHECILSNRTSAELLRRVLSQPAGYTSINRYFFKGGIKVDQHSNDSNKKSTNKFEVDLSPFKDFMQHMDRFFNQSFKQINSHLNWNPLKVDMYETDNDVIIKTELPGYRPEDIQLEIISNRLRITVEDDQTIENDVNHSKQRHHQKRERIVTLPFIIPENETKASFNHGLLKITVPKKNSKRKYLDIHDS